MLKHVLTGLAVIAIAGAVASCGGTDTRVVSTPVVVAQLDDDARGKGPWYR